MTLTLFRAAAARACAALLALVASTSLAPSAQAAWTATMLNPPGGVNTWGRGAAAGIQVGFTHFGNPAPSHAGLWNGSAATWTDLHPAGAVSSGAHGVGGVGGNQQVGTAYIAGAQHAGLWTGTAGSFVDLHPAGAAASAAHASNGTQQAGATYSAGTGDSRAAMWSGTAATYVDLQPAVAVTSEAYAISATHQAGYVGIGAASHAALWAGSAATFVDMHPTGLGAPDHSYITATDGVQHGGATSTNDSPYQHAALWNGGPDSWVDLHPAGATNSFVKGVGGGYQVGAAALGGQGPFALLWNGSPDWYFDLHTYLPPGYRASTAESVWTDGVTIQIVGIAYLDLNLPGADHDYDAVLWTNTIPAPGAFVGFAVAVGAALIRRRDRCRMQMQNAEVPEVAEERRGERACASPAPARFSGLARL